MKLLGVIVAAVALVSALQAQPSDRPQILVLGTYHMASPGRDLFNTQVDDVMSPKRQAEIVALLEALKRFRPTKIAIEANVSSTRAKREYASYRDGKYTLTPNEIDQIGYRLAKELGHRTVYPVDEDGDFPFYRVRNYAIANGRKEQFEAAQALTSARVKNESAFLASHTVLEHLQFLNADSSSARAVGEYYTSFMPYGEPHEYAGADLIASWFQRNLRIYSNLCALLEPGDRVLVIYGSGHLGWFRQIIGDDPRVRLVRLADIAG
jgi:hypothetical protein